MGKCYNFPSSKSLFLILLSPNEVTFVVSPSLCPLGKVNSMVNTFRKSPFAPTKPKKNRYTPFAFVVIFVGDDWPIHPLLRVWYFVNCPVHSLASLFPLPAGHITFSPIFLRVILLDRFIATFPASPVLCSFIL